MTDSEELEKRRKELDVYKKFVVDIYGEVSNLRGGIPGITLDGYGAGSQYFEDYLRHKYKGEPEMLISIRRCVFGAKNHITKGKYVEQMEENRLSGMESLEIEKLAEEFYNIDRGDSVMLKYSEVDSYAKKFYRKYAKLTVDYAKKVKDATD